MMKSEEQWLLPEGVEEILPERAAVIEGLRRRLLDLYALWGYELVFPPLIDFLDSLLKGSGRDLERETFKLTDQLSGRLLGVRADITPQVARMDAHSLRRQSANRLCYCSSALRTQPPLPGASRIPYQLGVELFGHDGVDADAEVIALMLATLDEAGVQGVTLDLGHVGIYRALVQQAQLSSDDEFLLTDLYLHKARTELDAFLAERGLSAPLSRALAGLPWLAGERALEQGRALLAETGEAPLAALERLARIVDLVRARCPDLRLHLDLGELRGYRYHTGCIFAAYVDGHAEPFAKGGRYDCIGAAFGRARPATGFSADLKLLALHGMRPPRPPAILAPAGTEPALLKTIADLRAGGERVIQALDGIDTDPAEFHCDRRLVRHGDRWTLESLQS